MEKNTPRSSENKFNGRNCTDNLRRIDALKGNIYDCTDSRQADLYTTTTKEISGYVAIMLKNGKHVRKAIEDLSAAASAVKRENGKTN